MRKTEFWILAAILLLGGFLRVFHLDTMFFNGDEPLHQVRISYQPLRYVLANNNGPLFSLLSHVLLPLGRLEVMARLVSVVSGFLIIILTFFLGQLMFSRSTGLMAALFVACSHLLVFFAQNSRTYALLTLLFLLSFYCLYRAVRDGAAGYWALYGLALTLFLYNHTIAFSLLPAYALFAGFAWLDGRRRASPAGSTISLSHPVRYFLLWTGAAVGLAVLLYLPCAWMRDMFFGSLERGLSRPSDGLTLTAGEIRNILQIQISPTSTIIFILTLAFFAVGLAARLKADRQQVVLILSAVIFPWLVFVLGKPRANDVYSLYRYLQFLLPLIFLLAARGIESLGSWLRALAARLELRRPGLAGGVAAVALAGVLAGGYFSNLGGYYFSDYWRQGSYRFDRDVVAFLEKQADRDALVVVDAYPTAAVTLMLNPLARVMRPQDAEVAAREAYIRPSGASQVMIYVLEWPYFIDYVASRKVELWAIAPKHPETSDVLRSASASVAGVEVTDLSRTTVLHFKEDGRPVAERMASLADILLAAPGDAVLRRQRLILAAKAFFMTRDVRDGVRCLRDFEAVPVDAKTEADNGGTRLERFLGHLLGFSPQGLRQIYERRALGEVQTLALSLGNNLTDAGRLADAALAYDEVLRIGPDLDSRVLDLLVVLGDRFEKTGDPAGALKAWETAARLDPRRQDIQARIARVRPKEPTRR
jgi:tetratricopeptide (TPR) repeat protein